MNKLVKLLLGLGLGKIPGVSALYKFIWGYFGPKGTRLVEVDGLKMYIACRDWAVAPTMLFAHTWEPEETILCKQYIKRGMTMVDIGAYVGYYSLLASSLVGDGGKVYAFEPCPESLDLLYENKQLNKCKNIRVYEEAITDKVGYANFYPNPHNLSGSMITGNNQSQLVVPTTTLDDIISGERVDFIKIDVEGNETKALYGMGGVISNNPTLKMIIEVYPKGLIRSGSSLEELVDILQCNFELHIISKGGLTDAVNIWDIWKVVKKIGAINLFCQKRGASV